MKIVVKKLTDVDLVRKACAVTQNASDSKMTLDKIYKCEHSPMRTQIFWVEMYDIPTYVSVHFVRHKVGVEHFVRSNREELAEEDVVDRCTPVNHFMFLNAQTLVNLSRKRLCTKADRVTTEVMSMIKSAVREVDPDLADYMVPECFYRGGICHEPKPCGIYGLYK